MVLTIMQIPILIIGIVIYKFKVLELLAGYNADKVEDKDGLARWTGINIIFMAFTNLAIDVVFYILKVEFEHKTLLNIVVILLFVFRILIGNKKYKKN